MHLTADQEDLRAAVRGLLDRYATADDRQRWQRLCAEIGVAGLAVPERFGGAGAGPVEVQIVMEELGRLVGASPMLGSAVLATGALLASGDEAASARLLPGLIAGTETAALAWTTEAGRFDPAEVACAAAPAEPAGLGWSLIGTAHYVLDGAEASVLLVAARVPDGTLGLFEVPPDQPAVTRSVSTSVDESRRLAVIRLAAATGRRLGRRISLAGVRDTACIALSGEQAGAAAAALAATVAYTKLRVQFGQPIAAFQALQHRMAEMQVLVASARSLSYAAAEAAGQGAADTWLRAAAAKAYCSEALQRVSAEMIQLHGAIGMTWEHPAHRFFKRADGAAMLLGTPASHVARVAAAVIDGPTAV
jgi:hypothetical protein